MISLLKALYAGVQHRRYQRIIRAHKAHAKEGRGETYAADRRESVIPDTGRLPEEEIRQILSAQRGDVGISIIIPSKDQPVVLSRCIDSLLNTFAPDEERLTCEIIVVDNGSNPKNRIKVVDILNNAKKTARLSDCKYVYRAEPFHFSRMCNRGAAEAAGDLLLFLNDDTEALQSGWLSVLAAFALSDGAGAVGAKLLYPHAEGETALIQHCGIVNAFYGPVHPLQKSPDGVRGFWDYADTIRRVIAVTGACLMIRKDLFLKEDGFSEELPVAFNDVDLCYRLYEAGYHNLCVNTVRLKHYESLSRGDDTKDADKLNRLAGELETLVQRHPALVYKDPYFDPRLSTAPEILPFAGMRADAADGLTAQTGERFRPEDEGYVSDPCVYVNIEYAGALSASGLSEAGEDTEDLLICGFSFVAGADNALYDRFAVLQKVVSDGQTDNREEMLKFDVTDVYRPQKAAQFENQTNCGMGGFLLRIAKGVLDENAAYRIGMCVHKRHTAQRLYHKSVTILNGNG